MTPPVVGDTVADFEADSTQGRVKLSDWRGKVLVIYFYPKNHTPGCTTESQNFRDLYTEFQDAGADVVGVSRDTVRSHENFIRKHDLPFTLISDASETLCNQFDVIKQKNMYGRQVRGIERSTFVINRDGKLVQEWRKVKVPGHAQAVLEFVKTL